MSRTYRRRRQRYEYSWVLRDWKAAVPSGTTVLLDPRSSEGRRAIARFHLDKEVTIGGAARRWLADSEYDPVIQVRHRHNANWSWW